MCPPTQAKRLVKVGKPELPDPTHRGNVAKSSVSARPPKSEFNGSQFHPAANPKPPACVHPVPRAESLVLSVTLGHILFGASLRRARRCWSKRQAIHGHRTRRCWSKRQAIHGSRTEVLEQGGYCDARRSSKPWYAHASMPVACSCGFSDFRISMRSSHRRAAPVVDAIWDSILQFLS